MFEGVTLIFDVDGILWTKKKEDKKPYDEIIYSKKGLI